MSTSASAAKKRKAAAAPAAAATGAKSNLKQGNLFSFFSKKPAATPAPAAASATSAADSKPAAAAATAATAATATATATRAAAPAATSNNSLWKKVQVGDRIRVWWADDRQYYAAKVLACRQQQFSLRYDDGESEWIDLSLEKFQILNSASEKKRRRIDDDDDDDDDDEVEWQDTAANDNDDDDEESEYEAKDVDDDEEEEDEEDWMVTDDDDEEQDAPAAASKKPKKRPKTAGSKTAKLQVTEHKTATTPRRTLEASSAVKVTQPSAVKAKQSASNSTGNSAFKTPLRQFANTVSPATTGSSVSTAFGRAKTTAGASLRADSAASALPLAASKVTSSPKAPSAASSAATKQRLDNNNSKKQQPPNFIKNAVNVQGSHVHNHLGFLQDPRDAQGRRPDEPGYNPRTLLVQPRDWLKVNGAEMTNAVQQWWDLKSQYYDTVLLFKTGKFYELFHMDADVGVQVLGLSYMKGIVAHAGFPEISYGPMADKLVKAGYKVARVEQTETPDQLKERKAVTKGKKPSVVNREVCSIVSLGTRTYCALDDEAVLEQLDKADNSSSSGGPLLAISETLIETTVPPQDEEDDQTTGVQPVCEYGITLIDAVRGTVTLGQFADDVLRSRMHTLLARMTPSEILLSDTASPILVGLVKSYLRSAGGCRLDIIQSQEAFPKSTALNPTHRKQLERTTPIVHPWNVQEMLEELHRRGYYPRGSKTDTKSIRRWPAVLQAMVEGQAELGLASFGAALFYLQRHLIDREILSMGIVKAYIPEASTKLVNEADATNFAMQQGEEDALEQGQQQAAAPFADMPETISAEDQITYLSLDGTTLHNLEILANSIDHKVAGSLWSKLNYCKSPHGARFLRAWLLRPLFVKSEIDRRADAVQELASGAGAVALQEARQHVLGKIGDLDRLLSRIHSMSGSASADPEDPAQDGSYHPNERAVLYENATYTKRKVNDFSKALNGLRKACQIPELFADLQLNPHGLLFKLVKLQGTDGGRFPNMVDELDWFFDNFDLNKAAQGLFEPSRGVDEIYDEASDTIARIQAELEDYRQEMCQHLTPKHVARSGWKYINTKPESKDKYLIELPASVQVPDDFLVKGKRGSGMKQVNKYRTPVVGRLVAELEQAIEIQQDRKAKGMQLIFAKFDSKRSLWRAAAQATAMLDALGSLAKVAAKPGFCRPTILDCPLDQPPVIEIVQGRHPCVDGSSIHSTEFIPNDLRLGGTPTSDDQDAARLLLLSGPNMGGKSTLLRQTCLIAILAQMGSYVPAESCSLTPVDCIYTRLGASDRILLGQSTFFVELAETAAALRGATRRSLVIMDELGRGTSTFDGTAIAGATVKHLVQRSQCLTLFATHYHSLLDEWKNESSVRLGHMQCLVEDSADDSADHSITFLYTLGPGTCPKSFGINVARLASLPAEVLANAKRVSEEFEEEMAQAQKSDEAATRRAEITAAIESENWEEVERLWTELQHCVL